MTDASVHTRSVLRTDSADDLTDPGEHGDARVAARESRSDLVPEQIFGRVYDELRAMAEQWFRMQPAGHTLQPTALVNEAYLRFAKLSGDGFANRAHLLATIAKAMRQILVDHARANSARKRGGGKSRVQLDAVQLEAPSEVESEFVDLERLQSVLLKLERLNSRQSEIVELRFFGGLTIDETAQVLEISPRTVKLDWQFARAWLMSELRETTETV